MCRRTRPGDRWGAHFMIQPLNFSPKAIDDLLWLARQPNICATDRDGIKFVADLLIRAQPFVLPDAGELLDRSKPRPQVPGRVFRPPFPVVALEYRAVDRGQQEVAFQTVNCSKRISLAWEWDGVMPGAWSGANAPKAGDGVVIASIVFVDQVQRWQPVSAAVMIPFEAEYAEPLEDELTRAFVSAGRISKQQAAAPRIVPGGVLPLLPDYLGDITARYGMTRTNMLLSGDLMDEVGSYMDLCMALACRNVSTREIPAPSRLNKQRVKGGKQPLKGFRVLEIAGQEEGQSFDRSGRGGVRSHLRRGHIRRLGSDRITWVNATMVRGSRAGFVDKQYAPRPNREDAALAGRRLFTDGSGAT